MNTTWSKLKKRLILKKNAFCLFCLNVSGLKVSYHPCFINFACYSELKFRSRWSKNKLYMTFLNLHKLSVIHTGLHFLQHLMVPVHQGQVFSLQFSCCCCVWQQKTALCWQEKYVTFQTRLEETGREEQTATTNLKQGSQRFKIAEVAVLYYCECNLFSPETGSLWCYLMSQRSVQWQFCLFLFSVEMSGHDMVCFDKTFEAAEALLHMESPGGLHSERNTGKHTINVILPPLCDGNRSLWVIWTVSCKLSWPSVSVISAF